MAQSGRWCRDDKSYVDSKGVRHEIKPESKGEGVIEGRR